MNTPYKTVLTIAGSDSGGCAGIQADIKSISVNGAFASSVITATTAQNTVGVSDIHAIPIAHIEKQLEAVLSDIAFGAVKIGMLHSAEVIKVVAQKLKEYAISNIILDPVMVSTSGTKLLSQDAITELRKFLPKCLLITPNIPEAEILLGREISLQTLEASAKEIGEQFSVSVLLKGGHLEENEMMTDMLYLYDEKRLLTIENPRVETNNTRGTGCSLSSAIATNIALGYTLEVSVFRGCGFINEAIEKGKDRTLGEGNASINHFGL